MSAFRKIAAVVAGCVLTAGCSNGVNSGTSDYDVDQQTGLCFRTNSSEVLNNYAITNVPCTQEVLALVPPAHRAVARVVDTRPAP